MGNTAVFVSLADNSIACGLPYNPTMLNAFKRLIPSEDRKWDGKAKMWLIDPAYIDDVVALAVQYGYIVNRSGLSGVTGSGPRVLRAVWRMIYVGNVKDRGQGVQTASGMSNIGQWLYTLPYSVLTEWFGVRADPTLAENYYDVLGVKRRADEMEIKKAYRRLVRQWHPDVCAERNAAQVFQAIQQAYETLSNPSVRGRYDFGLQLEDKTDKGKATMGYHPVWNPPLRCGDIDADAVQKVSGFHLTKIHSWNDITNDQGQTMVSTWKMGDDEPTIYWR